MKIDESEFDKGLKPWEIISIFFVIFSFVLFGVLR